jgi:hypothetical protein
MYIDILLNYLMMVWLIGSATEPFYVPEMKTAA